MIIFGIAMVAMLGLVLTGLIINLVNKADVINQLTTFAKNPSNGIFDPATYESTSSTGFIASAGDRAGA